MAFRGYAPGHCRATQRRLVIRSLRERGFTEDQAEGAVDTMDADLVDYWLQAAERAAVGRRYWPAGSSSVGYLSCWAAGMPARRLAVRTSLVGLVLLVCCSPNRANRPSHRRDPAPVDSGAGARPSGSTATRPAGSRVRASGAASRPLTRAAVRLWGLTRLAVPRSGDTGRQGQARSTRQSTAPARGTEGPELSHSSREPHEGDAPWQTPRRPLSAT